MKKLATLLLAAGLVFTASQSASAVEVKPYGYFEVLFENHGNLRRAFQDTADVEHNTGEAFHDKRSSAIQRLTLGAHFVMSENLSATYEGVFGYFTWGGPATGNNPPQQNGGALGSRSANIVSKLAYLDWVMPGTDVKIRMGLQNWFWPSYAVGTINPADGNGIGSGILVNVPINDNVGVSAGWMRATSGFRRGTGVDLDEHRDDNMDYFVLTLPIKAEGVRLTPWATVAVIGKDQTLNAKIDGEGTGYADSIGWKAFTPLAGAARQGMIESGHGNVLDGKAADKINWGRVRGNSTAWWGGLGGELTMFDPFRFAFDAAYSAIDTKYDATDRAGWLLALSAAYKTAYGVPTLKFWYASGDDGNVKNGSERPLMTGAFNSGSPLYLRGNRLAGNMVVDAGGEVAGTWGLSAQWNKASFIEGLYHNVYVTYIQGTNSKKMATYVPKASLGQYLTTKDSLVEITFDSVYSIYKNLAAMLELSYAFENMDNGLWGREQQGIPGNNAHFSNAWRADLKFMYTF